MATTNWREKGDRARDRKDWSAAAEAYRCYLGQHGADVGIWVQLGHALKEDGKLEDAVQAYGQATSREPGERDPHIHLAHLLKRLGDRAGALRHFQAAEAIEPSSDGMREIAALTETAPVRSLPRPIGARQWIEVRDILNYFDYHVTVTGITRVVLSLVRHVLAEMEEGRGDRYAFVSRVDPGLELFEVPARAMRSLADLAMSHEATLQDLQEAVAHARASVRPIKMRAGDAFIVPGAFWMIGDHGNLLAGMRRRGIRVGIYIYDLIPITHARYCDAGLTRAFSTAFSDNLPFVDFFLTISAFVAEELKAYIAATPYSKVPIRAVPIARSGRSSGSPSTSASSTPCRAA